jgi:hypothetical protein
MAPVILLDADVGIDEHRDFDLRGIPGVMSASNLMTARTNLDVQLALIARSRFFLSACGGWRGRRHSWASRRWLSTTATTCWRHTCSSHVRLGPAAAPRIHAARPSWAVASARHGHAAHRDARSKSMNRRMVGTALACGVLTVAYRYLSFTELSNDHFVHLSTAQQITFGALPVRGLRRTRTAADVDAVSSRATDSW